MQRWSGGGKGRVEGNNNHDKIQIGTGHGVDIRDKTLIRMCDGDSGCWFCACGLKKKYEPELNFHKTARYERGFEATTLVIAGNRRLCYTPIILLSVPGWRLCAGRYYHANPRKFKSCFPVCPRSEPGGLVGRKHVNCGLGEEFCKGLSLLGRES